jgi:hypothetical protein
MPTLGAALLDRYARFSLYNSPYPAHGAGRAIDLYPDRADEMAPSPVAGRVRSVHERRVPAKEYAEATDHVLLVDVDPGTPGLTLPSTAADGGSGAAQSGDGPSGDGWVARLLHVDPAVEPGDRVEPGESLGRLVRSGFFAPWVADHLHLEFRRASSDLLRARGSPRLGLADDVRVTPVSWDGRGTVVAAGETYVRLDEPAHPGPGTWAALASDGGEPLDGGLRHYAGGGRYCGAGATDGAAGPADTGDGPPDAGDASPDPVSLLGERVGVAAGRDVTWDDVAVRVDGEPVTGLSLFVGADRLGAKIVWRDHPLSVGDRVTVTVRPTEDPVRLG